MKTLLAWSSGKDSAFALHVLRQQQGVEVVGLVTTLNETHDRVASEARLKDTGVAPVFPLWQRPTRALAAEMLESGLEACLTCIDPRVLPAFFAGRAFDAALLAELPAGVDPCGENGEFHTFAWKGPMFHRPVAVRGGEVVARDGFVFADLLPADA